MRENYNMNNTCRLCLKQVDETQFTSIFPQTYLNGVSLVMKIMVCVSLTIQEDDPFPKTICRSCEKLINTFYSFRETCCCAYFRLIQNFSQSTESAEISEPADTVYQSSLQNLRNGLSGNNCESILPLQTNEKLNAADQPFDQSLERRNSSFNLDRSVAQHRIMCLDNESQPVVFEEEGPHVTSMSKTKIELQLLKPEKNFNQKEIPEVVEELSSTVDEDSLTTYNVDVDCYQVEEIHEQVFSGQDISERVRYRCTICENNFDDLESVTAHYHDHCQHVGYQEAEQASVAKSNDEGESSNYLDGFEYLDGNFELEPKKVETLKSSNNIQLTKEEIDSTNNSDTSDPVETQTNNVIENRKQIDSVTRDITSSDNSNATAESFFLVSKKSCDVEAEENLDNPTSKSELLNLRKIEKGKGRWSEKVNHPCSECGRIFSSTSLLKRHTSVHTGERPHVCEICDRRFAQVGQLNFHRKFHNNPRYRCHICSKPFLRPSDIEKHMRTHTGEKPYDCKICLKSFAQLGALQQHSRIHSGEKPYSCEICGKQFSQKANKTKHVKIHKEGERPHTCHICGRSFSELSDMELHRAGHGGGRPRKCDYCEESFRKLSELNHHVRRFHTFERQHKCMFCLKEFYSIYNLKQHVMVHTGQRPYSCSKCDLRFTQKGNLTKHFERKHSEFVHKKNRYILLDGKSFEDDNLIFVEETVIKDNPDDQLIVEREETIESEADKSLKKDNTELS